MSASHPPDAAGQPSARILDPQSGEARNGWDQFHVPSRDDAFHPSDFHDTHLQDDAAADAASPAHEMRRPGRDAAGAWLTLDLCAVAENWRLLKQHVGAHVRVGAAVKADAYGLGLREVAPVLARAGCREFFVAHLEEGLSLRKMVPRACAIFVLHGPMPGTEDLFVEGGLIPILNDLPQIEGWSGCAARRGERLACAIQIDSGMTRFGLSAGDVARLAESTLLSRLLVVIVMTHLACADMPEHPANRTQLETFRRLRPLLPDGALSSLAASSGIFLGPAFQGDLVRPGAALYGVNPTPGRPNPMRAVVTLRARMIQLREVGPGAAIGYGATFVTKRPSRIAILSAGYADGISRAASSAAGTSVRAHAVFPGRPELRLPVVGRVSMDSLAVDVTDLGPILLVPGDAFELIGPNLDVDEVARGWGTIGYEVLTSLGGRYHRDHIWPE